MIGMPDSSMGALLFDSACCGAGGSCAEVQLARHSVIVESVEIATTKLAMELFVLLFIFYL